MIFCLVPIQSITANRVKLQALKYKTNKQHNGNHYRQRGRCSMSIRREEAQYILHCPSPSQPFSQTENRKIKDVEQASSQKLASIKKEDGVLFQPFLKNISTIPITHRLLYDIIKSVSIILANVYRICCNICKKVNGLTEIVFKSIFKQVL